MIGYTTFGTNDIGRAAAFYDALFGAVGIGRLMDMPNGMAWGSGFDQPGVGVMSPHDGKPATAGNGTMVALSVDSRAKVEALHAKAVELGGADEGAPGPRGDSGFFGAYFRDLDGNKLAAFTMAGA